MWRSRKRSAPNIEFATMSYAEGANDTDLVDATWFDGMVRKCYDLNVKELKICAPHAFKKSHTKLWCGGGLFDSRKVKENYETLKKASESPDLWNDPESAKETLKTLKKHEDEISNW